MMVSHPLFESIFKHSPIASCIFSPTPEAIILAVNDALLNTVSCEQSTLLGKSVFEVFETNPEDGGDNGAAALRDSISQAIATGKTHCLPAQRYPIKKDMPDGTLVYEERFWNASNTPIYDADGNLACILHMTNDVTHEVMTEASLRESEERFRSLVSASTQMVWVNDPNGKNIIDSPSWRAFTGQSYEEWQDSGWLTAIHPEDQQRTSQAWAQAVREGTIYEIEYRVRRFDGQYRWTSVRAIPIFNADGTIREWVGTNTDIEEKKRSEEQLKIANQRLQLAVEGTGEGIWTWDIPSKTYTFSGGFNKILGRKEGEVIGRESDWHKAIHPEDRERVISVFQHALDGKIPVYHCEYRLKTGDGTWKWVRVRGVVVEYDDQHHPLVMTGTLTDITAKKQSDELLWSHANLDALTGLPNRRHFLDSFEAELRKAKRTGHQLALLFIDLDGFKQVNDVFGHDAGDLLLMEAAHRIRKCVRETDLVARLGGDEFTVALTELDDLGHIDFVCQKLLTTLSHPFQTGKQAAYISGSIGVTLSPLDGTSVADLLRKADQAMYAAKKQGKNQFSFFTASMDERAHSHLNLTNELRYALREKQLEVHYQPIVDLNEGHIAKAEALLRWHHPKMGNVEPSLFIPIAEESGLIRQIGDWVFKQAALCCKRCRTRTSIPFQISVNKSPVQFMSQDSASQWLQELAKLGLAGNSVSIEITEGLLLHASASIADKLFEYRDAGVQVAIDDFGTGYSSMAYLQKFDIDYLKIDQSFVQSVATEASSRVIAETMILMAHKLGLKVIAEGIETKEQLDWLIAAGCDFGQGFLFSRAVPAMELERMIFAPALPMNR